MHTALTQASAGQCPGCCTHACKHSTTHTHIHTHTHSTHTSFSWPRSRLYTAFSKYRTPPWMSLVEREDVPGCGMCVSSRFVMQPSASHNCLVGVVHKVGGSAGTLFTPLVEWRAGLCVRVRAHVRACVHGGGVWRVVVVGWGEQVGGTGTSAARQTPDAPEPKSSRSTSAVRRFLHVCTHDTIMKTRMIITELSNPYTRLCTSSCTCPEPWSACAFPQKQETVHVVITWTPHRRHSRSPWLHLPQLAHQRACLRCWMLIC